MSGTRLPPEDPWLGRLPEGWSIRRLGTLGSFSKGSGGSKEDNRDAGVPVVRYGDLYTTFDTTITEPVAFVDEAVAHQYAPLPTGTLVFTASGEDPEEIGKAALSLLPPPAAVGGDAVLLRPSQEVSGLFLAYALQSAPLRSYKAVRSTGFTVVHISAAKLKTLPIPLPPLSEQCAIADFLDRETAKIDALIEKQNELIDLLRERRDTVVESVLTAAVPTKLGYLIDVLPGNAFASEDFSTNGDGIRLLRGINVKPGEIDWSEEVRWSESETSGLSRYHLDQGDIVLGLDRPFVAGGTRVALMGTDDLPALLLQRVLRIRPRKGLVREFALLLLQTRAFREYAEPVFTGVSVPHLSDGQVRSFRAPVPPEEAQRGLAHKIMSETAKIDALIAKAAEFIGLARERRAALITAAVTGQIDVTRKAS